MSIDIFDFFSGCGGTSKGFARAGLNPVFALDFDEDATKTYASNFPDAKTECTDITKFKSRSLHDFRIRDRLSLFCGCAPCQPFTRQNTWKPKTNQDTRRSLLSYFGTIVEEHSPDYIFVENVPGMQRVAGNSTLTRFSRRLRKLGYEPEIGVVESQAYGIPQRRRRLVLLASKHGEIKFPKTTHGPSAGRPYSTVREWIGDFPEIKAGETHPAFPNHRAANLSEINLKRIMAVTTQLPHQAGFDRPVLRSRIS